MKHLGDMSRLFGVKIRLHWSLLLVLLWAGAEGYRWSNAWTGSLFAIGSIILFFICVLLHELSHVWVAQWLDIEVEGITVWPFGGLAKINYVSDKSWPELAIALAGPAINGLISALLLVLLLLIWGPSLLVGFSQYTETVIPGIMQSIFGGGSAIGLVAFLSLTNFFLAAFNLLPAFPLDGGRVLRAVLAFWFPYPLATKIAVRLGQTLALVTIVLTLTPFFGVQSVSLVFISVFVFVGATVEDYAVRVRSKLRQVLVNDVMSKADVAGLTRISPEETLGVIMERAFKSPQLDLPVVMQGVVTGMLYRDDLLKALQQGKTNWSVQDIMRTDFPAVLPTDTLHSVQQAMLKSRLTTLPVLQGKTLIGLVNIRDVNGVTADR
ncbi:MAG: site-2 protease family protein [Chloroflexota bacterium]